MYGSGGLPDGLYECTAVTMPGLGRVEVAETMRALYGGYTIEINDNMFTMKIGGMSATAPYSYINGTLIIAESASTSVGLDIDYRDGTLFWTVPGGMMIELKK